KVCRSTVEEVTEERSCWKVECEEICVPRVVLPWSEGGTGLTIFNWLTHRGKQYGPCCESCSARGRLNDACECRKCSLTSRCGDVRCVQMLKTEDYEVKTCKCNWDV